MSAPKQKNPEGKPLRFKTVKELQEVVDEYFDFCDNRIQQIYSEKYDKVIETINPAPYTMSGLARRIGICRQSLSEYSHKDQFGDTIKAAREKVHEDVECRLMEKQATGAIFNLKNNFDWRDKTETDLRTPDGPIALVISEAKNAQDSDMETR